MSALTDHDAHADDGVGALVVVHGYEDDPATLDPLVLALDPSGSLPTLRPRGPFATDVGPVWFDDDGSGLDPAEVAAAIGIVHRAIAEAADGAAGPVVLAGFSQGAALALAAAFRPDAPGPLGQLVLLAPFLLPPDVTPYDFDRPPAHGVVVVHGIDDDQVPLPMGKSAAKLLERRGVAVTMIEVDATHDLAALASHVAR